jgi:hypothetical protein
VAADSSIMAIAADDSPMRTVEIVDAIDIRRCKRALYFGRVITLPRNGMEICGEVRSVAPSPSGNAYLVTIKLQPKPAEGGTRDRTGAGTQKNADVARAP